MFENLGTLRDLFQYSTGKFGANTMNRLVDSNVGYTYSSFKSTCEEISDVLSRHGVGPEDKVAIFSSGHPNWSVAFFSATAFGRVAVPILPDFSANEADHVLEHSEAKVLFASAKQLAKLSEETLSRLSLVVSIETLEILRENTKAVEPQATAVPSPDSLACIIYTSGTTGAAKGVMLQHRNFIGNMIVGPSGENIYPEEIEKVAKEIPQIEDIIVINRGSKLVALVKCVDSLFDLANGEIDECTRKAIDEFKATVSNYVNERVSAASRINAVELMTCPFVKNGDP